MASERDQAVEKAQEVVSSWDACNQAGRSATSKAQVDLSTEELIEYLLEHFEGTVDPTQVPAIFKAGTYRLEPRGLEDIPEPMVPVAVMREILHTHKVMFNPKNVSNWKEFVKRFGRYIMGA